MGWFTYVCLFVCVILAVCVRLSRPWKQWMRARILLAGLPSFVKLPLIGNLHLFLGDGEFFLHQLSLVSKMMDVHLSPFVVWFGPMPFVEVSTPEDIKAVANAFADKVMQYQFGRNVYGDGLIVCPGSLYKHTSRKLSVAFNASVVAGFQHIFNDQAQSLVEQLKTEVGKGTFDVSRKYINWMAAQTIYHATFGVPNTTEHGITKEYVRALPKIMRYYSKRVVLLHQYSDFLYRLSADSKKAEKEENIINGEAERMIKHRRIEREKLKSTFIQNIAGEPQNNDTRFKPYIDILLDLSDTDPVFTHRQIKSELNSVMSAGHETVANTLTMCLLMIGSHEHVQDKLYAEMKEIFGESKRPVTKEDLDRMQYCEAVVNETLRHYPAGPLCFRQADRDLKLKQCTIPEGTVCGINIWGCGRSKHIWGQDAETFRPERWLETPDFHPFFIPFSYGKRTCIGKKYSMAMLKTTLAHCVRELVIKADTRRLRLRVYVTLQPFRGHEIQVQLRE